MYTRLNDTGGDARHIYWCCSNSYEQRSPLLAGGADKPGHGTGTWISEEPQMTLTYRGSSYEIGSKLPLVQPIVELQYRGKSYQARTSAAPAQVHATLTFRGASYAK